MTVYIRPLQTADALVSYKWRNDPAVWQYTGKRPDRLITPEIELQWIEAVMNRPDQKRFAICIKGTDQYIGNIQLTDIGNRKAQYHIFIGEKSFWGKGLAKEATCLILEYAFNELNLDDVYLEVNTNNASAYNLYKKIGFEVTDAHCEAAGFVMMNINKNDFKNVTIPE